MDLVEKNHLILELEPDLFYVQIPYFDSEEGWIKKGIGVNIDNPVDLCSKISSLLKEYSSYVCLIEDNSKKYVDSIGDLEKNVIFYTIKKHNNSIKRFN